MCQPLVLESKISILMLRCTVLMLIGTFLVDCYSENESDKQRLVKKIFENYNKKLRPVAHFSEVINVTLDPGLYLIVQVDENAETITITQAFRMSWRDAFIKWESSMFGEMRQLFIPISEIWYPDVSFNNRIDQKTPFKDENLRAIINYDGAVLVTIPQRLTIQCKFYISLFPFDIQKCTMIIKSWGFNRKKLDIFYKTPIDMNMYAKNSGWDLISMTARKSNEVNASSIPYACVYYDIVIQRKPSYYLLFFGLPSFLIMTVSIIGIFAPFNDSGEREEKVTMGLTTLLTMTVILPLITEMMPKSSEGLSLLGIYIMLQIAFGALTSLITVIVMYQNRKWTAGEPIPEWLLVLTRLRCKRSTSSAHETKCAKISVHHGEIDEMDSDSESPVKTHHKQQLTVILRNVKSFFGQINTQIYSQSEEENLRKEWQRATERLDVLLMIVFLVFNFILTACFLSIGYANLRAPFLLLQSKAL